MEAERRTALKACAVRVVYVRLGYKRVPLIETSFALLCDHSLEE